MAALELNHIAKSYGQVGVLHDISLAVADGEFVVLVGPSGCGKSTLLRVIAGLERANAGSIVLEGQDVTQLAAAERGLAMVFQSYALYPHMSVRQNIAFALENMRLPKAEIARRLQSAAEMLRLEPFLERRPGALSGGQRQRVAIGRAIVRDPKIFLFDEPLSNLDAELRVATRKELAGLHARIGGTMIYVTHDQVEAMTLADRIVVLRAGRIEQIGTPLELYNQPCNEFVAGFIGSPRMNLVPVTVAEGGLLQVGEASFAVAGAARHAPGTKATLGIRPEHIDVAELSGDVGLRVTLIEQLGGETFLYGTLSDGGEVTVRCSGQSRFKRGDTIGLNLQREHIHLFGADGLVVT